VARLKNRQITMEEATELFGILQDTLARTIARQPMPPAPTPPRPSEGGEPPPRNVPGTPLPITDEAIALSLIGLGVGAGLLSAILKRSAEGPRSPPPK
jgi:hypothetical protein